MKSIHSIFRIFSIAYIIISFSSCKEPIDIELQDAEPIVVIEATLSNVNDSVIIKISKTNDYMEAFKETIVDVNSAIIISENDTIECERIKNGYYAAPFTFKGFNKSYKVEVIENNIKYTATSTMKTNIPIDSIKISDKDIAWDTLFDKDYDKRDTLHLTIYFSDPVSDSNYYRLKVFVNDTLNEDTQYTFDDFYINGLTYSLGYETQKFNSEDKVRLEFIQYDKPTYTFFYTMYFAMGQQAGGTPFNPTSNFDKKDVFGYFAAYSADTITLPLKQINQYLTDNKLKNATFSTNTLRNFK